MAASLKINPIRIQGMWDSGFVLDRHIVSSSFLGYNESGHPEFDTRRSELGELVYKLKYKRDASGVPIIAAAVADFMTAEQISADVIVPMPPSRQRIQQPVALIASALGELKKIPVVLDAVAKTKPTAQMKDIGDYAARELALKDAFQAMRDLAGKKVLLIDDLFQSGASVSVVASLLKSGCKAASVEVLVLTRTQG